MSWKRKVGTKTLKREAGYWVSHQGPLDCK